MRDPPIVPSFTPSRRQALFGLASLALAACSSSATAPSTSSTGGGASSSASGAGGAPSTSSSSGAGGAPAKPALRVLFIGNSYTFVNDLPSTFQSVGESSGLVTVTVDSVAVPSATLADHVATTGAIARIQMGGWTHVVIQGQSVEPLFDPGNFEAAAATLAAEVKSVGAIPVFYETWARRAGDAVYLETWSGGAPAAMQAGLRAEYQKVADAAGAALAPAGDAWEKALSTLPAIGLFAADGSHPSVAGTYLTACVFHATIAGHSPVGIAGHPTALSDTDAAALQAVAEEVVGAPP